MSMFGLGGGLMGRRPVTFHNVVTPAAAPAGAWTAQGWRQFPPGRPSVVNRVIFILPPGVAGTLWVRPVYRDRGRNDSIYDLPMYAPGLLGYLTGDDLYLDMSMSEQFTSRHELGVLVQHTGAIDHAYTLIYEVSFGGGLLG